MLSGCLVFKQCCGSSGKVVTSGATQTRTHARLRLHGATVPALQACRQCLSVPSLSPPGPHMVFAKQACLSPLSS